MVAASKVGRGAGVEWQKRKGAREGKYPSRKPATPRTNNKQTTTTTTYYHVSSIVTTSFILTCWRPAPLCRSKPHIEDSTNYFTNLLTNCFWQIDLTDETMTRTTHRIFARQCHKEDPFSFPAAAPLFQTFQISIDANKYCSSQKIASAFRVSFRREAEDSFEHQFVVVAISIFQNNYFISTIPT